MHVSLVLAWQLWQFVEPRPRPLVKVSEHYTPEGAVVLVFSHTETSAVDYVQYPELEPWEGDPATLYDSWNSVTDMGFIL